jgi:hypothetical protein
LKEKLKKFRENPTVRSGSEGGSDEIKQKTIEGRPNKLEKEIRGLKKQLDQLKSGEVKPTPKDKSDKPEPQDEKAQ